LSLGFYCETIQTKSLTITGCVSWGSSTSSSKNAEERELMMAADGVNEEIKRKVAIYLEY